MAYTSSLRADGCRLYISEEGATWTDGGSAPCVDATSSANRDVSGGILGEDENGDMRYSPDGRTWSKVTLPATTVFSNPYVMSDGSLVAMGSDGPVRSTDGGQVWTLVDPGWTKDATSGTVELFMAAAGNRIVVEDLNGNKDWESSDNGATFHSWTSSAMFTGQFGDLVLTELGPDHWVGLPLPAAEAPGTTDTPTGFPTTGPVPTPSPQATPAGGISRQEAIRIAVAAVHAPVANLSGASVEAGADGRAVWNVSFADWAGSPGDLHRGAIVELDFFSGEVISIGPGGIA